MDLNVETIGDVSVVTLLGNHLDASNHEDFMRDVTPVLEKTPNVVLDIGELQSIDSSGLGAFAYCMRTARDAGGELKICKASERVKVTFDLVHIHRIIGIFETREQAIASYQNHQ